MKVFLFIIFFLVSAPLSGFSQFLLGAKGGYNISYISFFPEMDERPLYDQGFYSGLVAKYYDMQYIGFQGEVGFTQRGYRVPIDEGIYRMRVNSYLELPIFMQLRLQQQGFFIYINVGFYASFLLKSIEGDNQLGSYVLHEYEFSILRDNRFDYGLPGGVGIGYDFKWGTIQAEARFYYGLGDLYKYNYAGNPSRSPARVQNISLAYLYNFSRHREQKRLFEEIRNQE